ncbi:hypothetical protein AVEN_203092-1 [Araneus ventricosus]|uniref:Uncharacterized protein n=1 Tax=Araneus ventricosus TaxID=182803 RepID=A0A4Y2DPS3_ARAVE|nr:hypothetical protein AVEN_203092-1 [Araneus ventricosus]
MRYVLSLVKGPRAPPLLYPQGKGVLLTYPAATHTKDFWSKTISCSLSFDCKANPLSKALCNAIHFITFNRVHKKSCLQQRILSCYNKLHPVWNLYKKYFRTDMVILSQLKRTTPEQASFIQTSTPYHLVDIPYQ